MAKICRKCGIEKPYSEFYKRTKGTGGTRDGYHNDCKECFNKSGVRKHGPRPRGSNTITYRVVYDPCDSFGYQSEFTRREINDMLAMEFIAIGTRFQWKDRYYEINENMRMVKA